VICYDLIFYFNCVYVGCIIVIYIYIYIYIYKLDNMLVMF
jgi:hypothetical protein